MSILAKATTGKIKQPEFITIHGVDGVGKSSFGASAPKPFFLGPERGTANLNVARLAINNMAEFDQAVIELTNEKHDYQSLVIDSLDHLEALLWNDICERANVTMIEKYEGGYGKGYVEAVRRWREIGSRLSFLRDRKKMNIVLIAHSFIKTFNDPHTNSSYDRYILQLHEKSAAYLREVSDTVLFYNFETITKSEQGQKIAKAFGSGDRILFTERRPAFDAKNRDGLPAEIEVPNPKTSGISSWQTYMSAKASSDPVDIGPIKSEINALKAMIPETDPMLKTINDYIAKIGDDADQLIGVRNRLRDLTGQK